MRQLLKYETENNYQKFIKRCEVYHKACQVLQSVTEVCYKVSASVVTKCDRLLQHSTSGLESVTVITKRDVISEQI